MSGIHSLIELLSLEIRRVGAHHRFPLRLGHLVFTHQERTQGHKMKRPFVLPAIFLIRRRSHYKITSRQKNKENPRLLMLKFGKPLFVRPPRGQAVRNLPGTEITWRLSIEKEVFNHGNCIR